MTAGESSTLSGRPDVLDGPFSTPQLLRIDEALRLADRSTGLTFSVYVGDLDEPTREYAEKLHSQLSDPERYWVAKALVEQTARRVPAFVSTGCGSGHATIEFSQYAESIGADGLMVVAPK